MNRGKSLWQMFGIALVALSLAGCGRAPAGPPAASTLTPAAVTSAKLPASLPSQATSRAEVTAPAPPIVTTSNVVEAEPPVQMTRPAQAAPPDDDASALRQALAAYFAISPDQIDFNVAEQTESYVSGGVPGAYFLAAREEAGWVIVYAGQAAPGCAEIAAYDFPESIVPECLDENNNLVVRAADGMNESESGITIMGSVRDVSLSARIITLQESVQGFSVVALTEESELVSRGGEKTALRDIRPGMTIEASGVPGALNALLASQVLVLDKMPAPLSD